MSHQLREYKNKTIKHMELKTLVTSILMQNSNSNNFDIIFKLLDIHKDELFGVKEKEDTKQSLNDDEIINFLQKEGKQ